MTKTKALLVVGVMAAVLLLSGCEIISGLWQEQGKEHVHEYKYSFVDGEGHQMECACGWKYEYETVHEFEWGDTESYETAYKKCTKCGYKQYQKDLYKKPLSVYSNSGGGDDPAAESIVWFAADVAGSSFDYNEEFSINLKVSLGTYYLEDGPFQIKLEASPYFEIVGDKEFTVTKLNSNENSVYSMDFTFRVKATDPCNLPQAFDFKVKFNPTEYFLDHASRETNDGPWYYDPTDEFFYGFKKLIFINDSKGIILTDQGDVFEYEKFFYDSINREYFSGVIDENTYIDRLSEYRTHDKVDIWSNGVDTVIYCSKNIRAKMTLGDEYKHLFNGSQGSFLETRPLIASTILNILANKGFISEEEHQIEKAYLAEKGYNGSMEYILYEHIPIADYVRDNYYQFIYEDNSTSVQHNESNDLEENSTALFFEKKSEENY